MRVGGRAPFIGPTKVYEVRLLDQRARPVKIYQLRCRSESEARMTLQSLRDESCVRYELWLGITKLCEGPLSV